MNTTTTDITPTANRLTELCNKGSYREAIDELYADDATHIEAMEMPGHERVVSGKAKLQEMSDKWHAVTEIHGTTCSKPLINGEQFVCDMTLDVTTSEGPMAGKRHTMSETCLYTVKDGKITEAKFFYSM